MNTVLAGIYGTGGQHEKVAHEGLGQTISTLSDLALALAVESDPDASDLEKVASVHDQVLGDLIDYDRAGRAMAHHEFSEMEKEAAAGNWEPINAFFSDVSDVSEVSAAKQQVLDELRRRLQ